MRHLRRSWVLALWLLAAPGCDGDVFTQYDGGHGSAKDGPGSNKDTWVWPAEDVAPVPKVDKGTKKDAGCGGQNVPIKLVKKGNVPDLHLVVDRSGSMMTPIDIFNWAKGTKWDVMRKTITFLVDQYKGNIRFGLTLFPGDNSCKAGKIDVPLQTGNVPAIKSKLATTWPNGNTPTHTSLAKVKLYLDSVPKTKGPRFVLLATDGMPNCGADPSDDTSKQALAEVQKLAAAGTKVFVVGFGSIVAANPGHLNKLAQAGGKPNPKGPNKFYPATNEKELKAALLVIAGGIIPPPCTYKLNSKPPDPTKVTVTFDGKPVPRSLSSKDGWNYSGGGNEISFYGSACKKLRQGQVKQVKFLYGCKGPVIK